MLKIQQLSFAYKHQQVLDQICMDVPQGAIYGYLGKNGAGKSTTIKLLLGLLDTPSNTIYFQGKELLANKEDILKKIGATIESPFCYNHLTGFENLAYLDIIYKYGKERINKVLDIVGLKGHEHKKTSEYSSGMRQRLAIGMAIFHDLIFLVFDEPLNSLDPEGIHELRELMTKLRNDGKTIFLSSHLLGEAEKICTHIGVINKGKILYQGTIDKFTANIQRQIYVRINDLQKGCLLCTQHQIVSSRTPEGLLLVQVENDIEYNHFIQLMVNNNVDIYSIEQKENNLESMFLHLTTNSQE